MKKGYMSYGEFALPNDFPSLPFSIYRDRDGLVKHNFDFKRTGTAVYCNMNGGSDTTGDGSELKPYRSIKKALQAIEAMPNGNYIIKCKSERQDRSESPGAFTLTGKTVSIIPDNPSNSIFITNHSTGLTWTQDGTGTWKTTRSAVYDVFDLRNKDVYGNPKPLSYKGTVSECQATVNSWYTDGTDIWVHTNDGLAPNDTNFVICTHSNTFIATLLNNSELYLENVTFITAGTISLVSFNGDFVGKATQGTVITNNCRFIGGNSRSGVSSIHNGFEATSIKNVYNFNSISAYTARDGFNYHFQHLPANQRRNCVVFEYNCLAYKIGLNDTNTNNNATTAHDGANILRVGSIGYETKGPVLADVNGCYSVCIDCHMRDSVHDEASETNAAFYFDNINATATGKAILINSDGKSSKYSLAGQNGFDVQIENFKGKAPKSQLSVTYL